MRAFYQEKKKTPLLFLKKIHSPDNDVDEIVPVLQTEKLKPEGSSSQSNLLLILE